MIQKNRVVGIFAQKLLCLQYIVGRVNEIALESLCEPPVPPSVIVKEKYPNGVAFSAYSPDAEFSQQ